MPDVATPPFLLDPRNAAFVAGKAPRPVADDAASTFTLIGRVLLFFVVCVGLIVAWQFSQYADRPDTLTAVRDFRARGLGTWRLAFFGLLLAFALGALGYGEVLKRRDARLANGSRVIAGTIVGSRGEKTGSGYWVHVRYRIETPDYGIVEGTSRAVRPDLAEAGLPRAGREVAIWFRDPSTHRLL